MSCEEAYRMYKETNAVNSAFSLVKVLEERANVRGVTGDRRPPPPPPPPTTTTTPTSSGVPVAPLVPNDQLF